MKYVEELMEIGEQVYETLMHMVTEENELPWVTPIFVQGNPCHDNYCQMHRAYERLRDRLGITDEDPDVEEMIDCLLEYARLLGLEMFRCGQISEALFCDGKSR